LAAYGWLGDVESLGGAADVTFFGNDDEVLDLREAHAAQHTSERQRTASGLHARSKRYWTPASRPTKREDVSIEVLGSRETASMRRAGAAAAATLAFVADRLRAGISTLDIDRWVREHTARQGGRPSQLGYKGFPAAVCTSRNDVVCHGIPRRGEVLGPGDIINVDVTTCLDGFHGDTSATFAVGEVSPEARHVLDVARRCRDAGIAVIREGARLGDVAAAIEELAQREGCSVVREFGGHGIGRRMHMEPHVSHVGPAATGVRLRAGMVFTVEPMINLGRAAVRVLDDEWTVVTADGSLSAQFEHTVLVTREGFEILTQPSAGS
jgi:methionyl aminopeptidase